MYQLPQRVALLLLHTLAESSRGVPRTRNARARASLSGHSPASCCDLGVAGCWGSGRHAELPRLVCGPGGQRGHSQFCRTATTSQHSGLRYLWLVWIASDGRQPHVFYVRHDRFFSAVCLRSPLRILWLAFTSFTAWCSVP